MYKQINGIALITYVLLLSACNVDWFPDDSKTFKNHSTAFTNHSTPFTNRSSAFTNRSTAFANLSAAKQQLPVGVTADSTGIIRLDSMTFDFWAQDDVNTVVTIKTQVATTDGKTHSTSLFYAAFDANNTKIYSGSTGAFPAPSALQTSAKLTNADYLRVKNWVVTSIVKYN